MSGFEVAGVVLGAFPLAICALEKYREVATRLGLFYRIKLEYKKCSDNINYQQLILTSNLKQLLLPLAIDQDEIQELVDNPGGKAWKNASIVRLLQQRLNDSYELYLEYIKGMEQVMGKLCDELAMDDGYIQSKLKHPQNVTRVKSVLKRDDLMYSLYKLKFSNGEAVRTKLFGELQAYNDKLEKLLESGDKVVSLEQKRASMKHSSATETSICNVWIQAARLFKVLTTVWECNCSNQHLTKLLLQHKVTKGDQFEFFFIKPLSLYWEVLRARIMQGGDEAVVTKCSTETITLVETKHYHQPNHQSCRPAKSSMKGKGKGTVTMTELLRPPPSVTLTAIPDSRSSIHQPITNLCKDLQRLVGDCCDYLSINGDDCRYSVHVVSSQRRDCITSITLDHILRGNVYPPPTRRQRYTISLVLASSFLQLAETPWLTSAFRREDITFLSDPTNTSVFLLDQPHIARSFHTAPSTNETTTNLTQSLDQLGILLLELCFGKMLSDHPLRKAWPGGEDEKQKGVFDVMAARDWQCEVVEEAGSAYSEAVAWCLGGNRSTLPKVWRREMLKKVVSPLQRCQEYFLDSGVVY